MWTKSPDPYFDYTDFLDFHLSTVHSDSNMSANGVKRVYAPRAKTPDGVSQLLPVLEEEDHKLLEELKPVFARRRTSWSFDRRMTPGKLSVLLKAALGVTESSMYGPHRVLKKAYPSAGGEYSVGIHVYLQHLDCEELDGALYRYDPEEETLTRLKPLSMQEINFICSTSKYTTNEFGRANCIFFLTTDFRPLFSKYGKLAYRLSLLEAGHICQNLQIVSGLMELSSVPLGGFYDEYVRELLELNEGFCLYALAVG